MLSSFEVKTDSKGNKYFKTVSEGCGCCSSTDTAHGKSARNEILSEIEDCESRIATLRSMLNDFPETESKS